MEYWVCFWCCKTRAELVLIETKLSYEKVEKVEMAACVVGRVRDCVRRFNERHVAVVGIELWMSP